MKKTKKKVGLTEREVQLAKVALKFGITDKERLDYLFDDDTCGTILVSFDGGDSYYRFSERADIDSAILSERRRK